MIRKIVLPLLACALLSGCSWFSSSPSGTITLPARGEAATGPSDVRVEPVRYSADQPGCKNRCPHIEIDSIAFPDLPALTQAVDQGLATLTGVDANLQGTYRTLDQYKAYFWRTARPRDRTDFKARLRGVSGDVISVELTTSQYLGGAHGIPATRFLNWSRKGERALPLSDLIIAGRHDQYVAALRAAHERWLSTNPDYREDPATWRKLWPFQETDNAAFTQQGLAVRYDAYTIAPYSHGQPELLLDYESLRGILRPEYLPAEQ